MQSLEATLSLLFFLLIASSFLYSSTYYENDAYLIAELHDIYNVLALRSELSEGDLETFKSYGLHLSLKEENCIYSITRHSYHLGVEVEERLCITT